MRSYDYGWEVSSWQKMCSLSLVPWSPMCPPPPAQYKPCASWGVGWQYQHYIQLNPGLGLTNKDYYLLSTAFIHHHCGETLTIDEHFHSRINVVDLVPSLNIVRSIFFSWSASALHPPTWSIINSAQFTKDHCKKPGYWNE